MNQSTREQATHERRRLRVCIATPDIVGPVRNGGIGTAYYWLARALATTGHRVTLLYTLGDHCEQRDLAHWQDSYDAKGIKFVPLPEHQFVPLASGLELARSYLVYQWLKNERFDLIHFPEWRGNGFHSLLARRQGLHFSDTVMCVGTHSPSLWHAMGERRLVASTDELEVDFLERESVALADVVISPSRYLATWMSDQGWRHRQPVVVRPNLIDVEAGTRSTESHMPAAVNELVFFGRLERRKGLVLFCDALNRLRDSELRDFRVTFLGKGSNVDGEESEAYLDKRQSKWPWPVQILTDRDHAGAMEYLKSPLRMAVIPSLMENSPYTVLECLCEGIPFLAAKVGGIPELVAEGDRERTLFAPNAEALAQRLTGALKEGVVSARPSVSPRENATAWLEWHENVCADVREAATDRTVETPLVSVCITHYNRPRYLAQALASIREQDYPSFEVVLVDDGSSEPRARRYLDELEPEFSDRGWTVLRQDKRCLAAARNAAARNARGAYLLFMDDGNIAKPGALTTLVGAAGRSGADILTCCLDVFTGSGVPGPLQVPRERRLPLGAAAAVGMFKNCFGDVNALIRKGAFDAVGGFTEDHEVGHEHWHFFAKAVLRGLHLQVVPEAPLWYRATPDSMLGNAPQSMGPLGPYLEALPASLHGLVLLAQGQYLQRLTPTTNSLDNYPASGASPQALVDAFWSAASWRLLRPLRNLLRRARGLPLERKPQVSTMTEAATVVAAIQGSVSWELMGPGRVVSKTLRSLLRRTRM